MKRAWLDQLVKEGHVRKEAAEHIDKDCGEFLKQSKLNTELIMKDLTPVFQAAGIMGVAGAASMIGKSMENSSVMKSVASTRETLLKKPEFKESPEKFSARFKEIFSISPHAAANLPLMEKLLKRSLHSGLSDDDVGKLSLLQAHYTPKHSVQEDLTKRASIRPEVAGMILADIYQLTKTAGVSAFPMKEYSKILAMMVGVPLVGAAVGGGVQAAQSALSTHRLKKELEESFNKAMKLSDPDKEPLHANTENAREAFKVLAHFAPHVAVQPQAARSFMNKLISYGGSRGSSDLNIQTPDIKDLADIEKNIGYSGKPGFLEGFAGSAGALGLGSSLGKAHGALGSRMAESIADHLGYSKPAGGKI